jgi:chemotaxis protein MotB
MARKRRQQEQERHEAWAIPYGDLVTLLLAFFVVMYALSSVNEGKYRVLSDSLSAAFTGAPRSTEPVQVGVRRAGGGGAIDAGALSRTALPGANASALARIPLPSVGVSGATDPAWSEQERARMERMAAAQRLRREQIAALAAQVETVMAQMIQDGQLVVRRNDDWLEIEIRADTLFSSGSAALGNAAIAAIENLAAALQTGTSQIRVEGHTDNVPIRTVAFPSNWELSSARAAGVVRILAVRGIDPARLSVLGLGEHRPRESNASAAGRLANRRVLLIIQADPVASEPAAPAVPKVESAIEEIEVAAPLTPSVVAARN